jgi:Tfp pilus assembly protein PilZ
MTKELVERRSEFRFPVVLPVEYFKPEDSGISSYSLDLSKSGTFISSDIPLSIGSRFGINLTIPFNDESSKILRTEGTVVWDNVQPFKSKRNGMGVQFVEPLPESLLLKALANNIKKIIKETESKKALERRVEKLESELEETKRLATLGRCAEKILFDVSNPILTLSGNLAILRRKIDNYKTILEKQKDFTKKDIRKIEKEFSNFRSKIDKIIKDYKAISEMAHMVGDDRQTLERKLKRYNC